MKCGLTQFIASENQFAINMVQWMLINCKKFFTVIIRNKCQHCNNKYKWIVEVLQISSDATSTTYSQDIHGSRVQILFDLYRTQQHYEVRQFNSWNSRSVSLGCWVRQTRVLKHVWTCSNLRLDEPQIKCVVRSRASEEVVRVRGIRLTEKWVARILSSG
jgi:hypothetical protein